jgi:hypothetical protein
MQGLTQLPPCPRPLFLGMLWSLPYTKTNSWIYAYTYTQQDLKHEWNKKIEVPNLIHVRPTYFYTTYFSFRMEIIVDTLITKTPLGRARGSSLFCLGYFCLSKHFNYIAKDASILHLKLGNNDRPSLHPQSSWPTYYMRLVVDMESF